MRRTTADNMQCPVARGLDRVGEWWSMLILRDAFYGLSRFDDFQTSLGIAPNILSRRLATLVETGMLERHRYSTRPVRYEYLLTERGRDFRPVLLAMMAWGNRHFAPEGQALELIDKQTGRVVEIALVDHLTGEAITRERHEVRPGPAASERMRARIAFRHSRAQARQTLSDPQLPTSGATSMNAVTVAERADSPAVAQSTPRSKKKSLLRLAIGAAVMAGVIYGGHWWSVGRFIEDTDDAYVGGDVTVIGPKVPGYITQVAVTDNQVVHAGDLLVKIDDRDYRAALAKADGAVAAQQALLANLDATENLQQAVIRQAQASVAAADAETQRSRDDEARYRDLSSRSAVSIESAQRADATYKTARAGSDKAQAALIAAQRQIDVIASQKLQARAALQQAKAEQDIARLNQGYTELRAPVDGVVGNRRARTGAYAAAGTQLLSVVPAHGLWVDANFKEDQLARMSAGQAVDIRADVMPGRVFHGHLGSLAPATGAQFSVLPPENATGNFTKVVQRVPVRVVLDSKDDALGVLRPGLSVVAEVDTRGRVASP